MPVPYNMLPMEMLVAMSSAEVANAQGYLDAARMWTDVRTWIDGARTELRSRSESLLPHWQDAAAAAWAADVATDDADLAGWAARIDSSQVSATLTTLAGAITRTNQEVLALHGQYLAAMSSPLTQWMAPPIQQAAGAVMTALGAQFEGAIMTTATAAGIKAPDIPTVDFKPSAEGNSADDAIKAITATSDALSEVETLAGSLGLGQSGGGSGGLANYAGGMPSLAGMETAMPASANLTSGAMPGAGTAPTLSGMGLPYGTLGGTGFPATAKPLAAKRAPVAAADIAPGVANPAAAAGAKAGSVPPMMPPMAGQGAGAAVRPSASSAPTGRSRVTKKRTDASNAVPVDLRGRAGA